MPNSSANQFLEAVLSQGSSELSFDYLTQLISPATPETDWLEFKEGKIFDTEAELKAKWSKALSAFANTSGGIIVWGIRAKKGTDGVDAATELVLVRRLQAQRTRLDQLLFNAANPPVQCVDLHVFPDPKDADQGFIVSHIPESSFKPHRAEFANNHYYLRTGTSSSPMAPGTLRHMFYPQARSQLRLFVKAVMHRTIVGQSHHTAQFQFVLENSGKRTARDVFVVLVNLRSAFGFDHTQWTECHGYSGSTALEAKRSIHPQAKIPLGGSQLGGFVARHENGAFQLEDASARVEFLVRIYATDEPALTARISFSKEQMEQQEGRYADISEST